MNNREREKIALFLHCLDGNDIAVSNLFEDLNDGKLKHIHDEYQDLSETKAEMAELIQETAIDLWIEDYPKLAYDRSSWSIHRSYDPKKYWHGAIDKLMAKFKEQEDTESLDTLDMITD